MRPKIATWLEYSVMLINLPTGLVRITALMELCSQGRRCHEKGNALTAGYCAKVVFAHGELEVLSGEDQQDWL